MISICAQLSTYAGLLLVVQIAHHDVTASHEHLPIASLVRVLNQILNS